MTDPGLDLLPICLPFTAEVVKVWRNQLGFSLVCSEEVNGGAVRPTQLDGSA